MLDETFRRPEEWLARPVALPDPARIPFAALRAQPRHTPLDWLGGLEPQAALAKHPVLASAGAAVASKRLAKAAAVSIGPHTIERAGSLVRLRTGATVRWVLDAGAFGGAAQLALDAEPSGALVRLRGAFYPGTSIPADLKARFFVEDNEWQVRIRLKLGGFDATVPLERFLDRTQPAASLVHLALGCVPLGTTSELRADGVGVAALTADGLLALWGADLFALEGLGDTIRPDVAFLIALPPAAPPFLLPSGIRRTVALFAFQEGCRLQPQFDAPWPRVS